MSRLMLRVQSPGWHHVHPRLRQYVNEVSRAALAQASASGVTLFPKTTISILLGDDATVKQLNAQWRQKDGPTNVLSFPAPAGSADDFGGTFLGDVVLAFETVSQEAGAQMKPLAHHMAHLLIHGILHLLGFDHEESAEAERMEKLEIAALSSLNIPDPYGDAVQGNSVS